MRDLFVSAAASGEHCVLSAAISRGCPGEPDDAICGAGLSSSRSEPLAERVEAAIAAVRDTTETGQPTAAQFSLYVMGTGTHMDEIYGCIDFLKRSGTFDRSKNFCTKLRGDAGAIFATIHDRGCARCPLALHPACGVARQRLRALHGNRLIRHLHLAGHRTDHDADDLAGHIRDR